MKTSLHAPLSLLGLVLFPFLAAALLAPWVWRGLHGFLDYPFPRYVDRCLMVSALLGLALFWKGLGIGWDELGWRRAPARTVSAAARLGLISAALALELAVLCGGREWLDLISLSSAFGILAGALALSLAEECLFRGVVQTVLAKRFGPFPAIAAGSLLFALLHYLKVPADFRPFHPGAGDGFRAVGLAFTPFAGGGWLQPRLGLLVAVGAILGLLRWRSGSLWPCVALHAAWVFAARVGTGLTLGYPSHWAGGDFSANPLSFVSLALVALAVWKFPVFSSTPHRR
ncbi:MAG TPA: CPBP family intramembrane glutamic endopeptidase [Candidatus Methylacidiphilales bacterium]